MTTYSQGDPRQKIQMCVICEEPTGRCEEDSIYHSIPETGDSQGPLCEACYDEATQDPQS